MKFADIRAASNRLHDLTIHTHVPQKWRAVDLETGDVWANVNGRWVRASARNTAAVLDTIGKEPE